MAKVVGVQYSAMNTYTTTTVIWYRKQRVEETQRHSVLNYFSSRQ